MKPRSTAALISRLSRAAVGVNGLILIENEDAGVADAVEEGVDVMQAFGERLVRNCSVATSSWRNMSAPVRLRGPLARNADGGRPTVSRNVRLNDPRLRTRRPSSYNAHTLIRPPTVARART